MEITRGVIPTAKKVVIYGPEGIGKSTLASKFPDPVFIDTEGSTNHMDVARLPAPSSWQMLLQEQYSIPYLIVLGLTFLVTPFYALILPMACITAGAVLAKKHKILASFGVYYGVNFMVGIITSVVSVVPTLLIMSRGDTEGLYLVSMAIQLVISLALTIGAYCFTIQVMKKKLNLP